MKRGNGYYWVNYKGAWLIALYNNAFGFWLCGFGEDYPESAFIEIGSKIKEHK